MGLTMLIQELNKLIIEYEQLATRGSTASNNIYASTMRVAMINSNGQLKKSSQNLV